jgi:hypothetical protein
MPALNPACGNENRAKLKDRRLESGAITHGKNQQPAVYSIAAPFPASKLSAAQVRYSKQTSLR